MLGPILVEFKELEKKVKVLKVARNLKGTKYGKVFINQDLTEAEMARDKELRKRRAEENEKLTGGEGRLKWGLHKFGNDAELSKFYWGVRDGELRRIKKSI